MPPDGMASLSDGSAIGSANFGPLVSAPTPVCRVEPWNAVAERSVYSIEEVAAMYRPLLANGIITFTTQREAALSEVQGA